MGCSARTGGLGLVDVAVPALMLTGNQLYRRRKTLRGSNKSYHKRNNKTYHKRSNKTYRRRR